MNRCRLLAAALFLGTLAVGAGSAQETKGKAAATPEDAVKNIVEAAKKGDTEGFISQFVKPMRETMQQSLGMEKPLKDWFDALDEKFGKDKNAKRQPTFKEQFTNLKAAKVEDTKKEGDVVVLTISATELKDGKEETKKETLGALKEGDGWKLFPPGPDGKITKDALKQITAQTDMIKAQVPRVKEALAKLTKDVKDGKFKTREEAQKAFLKSLEQPKKEPPKDGGKQ